MFDIYAKNFVCDYKQRPKNIAKVFGEICHQYEVYVDHMHNIVAKSKTAKSFCKNLKLSNELQCKYWLYRFCYELPCLDVSARYIIQQHTFSQYLYYKNQCCDDSIKNYCAVYYNKNGSLKKEFNNKGA